MKTWIYVALLLCATHGLFGQGTVYFSNLVRDAGIDAPVFYGELATPDGPWRPSGSEAWAQLYASVPDGSLAPVGARTSFYSDENLAGY